MATILLIESPMPETVGGPLQSGVQRQLRGRIYGTVEVKQAPLTDVPARRRVLLEHQDSGVVVRETLSDPITGVFEFRGIDEMYRYCVRAYDHTGDKRAVIADGLTLANGGVELMP